MYITALPIGEFLYFYFFNNVKCIICIIYSLNLISFEILKRLVETSEVDNIFLANLVFYMIIVVRLI